MVFKISDEQQDAIDMIYNWYHKRKKKMFFLSGRAGTGKTTIVAEIIKKLGLASASISAACPTGKAVNVLADSLQGKGVGDIEIGTIHSLIYYPATTQVVIDKDDFSKYRRRGYYKLVGKKLDAIQAKNVMSSDRIIVERLEFTRKPAEKLRGIKLIIVDEASMVTSRIYDEITSYGIKVLFVGDTAQLPPVENTIKKIDVLGQPDVQLIQIHRQGKDSEIIRLANDIYEGKPIIPGVYGKNGEVVILSRNDFMNNIAYQQQAFMLADQIICARNDTRHYINQQVRLLKGIDSKYPVVGDKVISLKNNRDLYVAGNYLVNGQIGYITDVGKINERGKNMDVSFVPLGEDVSKATSLLMSTIPFDDLHFEKSIMYKSPFNFFDFGYAITCHKSQGSQWDDVLIIEERLPNSHNTHKNWLYTAVTRAKGRLILVLE